MERFIVFAIVIVFIVVIRMAVKKNREQEMAEQEADAEQNVSTEAGDTFKIMNESLKKLGCQPKSGEEGVLQVGYQGENFQIDFSGPYVRIWDCGWSAVRADDPDLPKVREAVNRANFMSGPTVVMSAPNEDNYILFHPRTVIMLHPSIPKVEDYVKATLDTFFQVKYIVRNEYQNIGVQQQEQRKKRRKVGFCQSEDGDKDDNSE